MPTLDSSADARRLQYFNSWVPGELLLKGLAASEDSTKGPIAGVVSTSSADIEGDRVAQGGLMWDYFLQHGWFDDNHDGSILGYPTGVTPGDEDTQVEGYLLLQHPRASQLYKTAQLLKKAKSPRRLGFSVQGKVIERDPQDSTKITKAIVFRVAITEHPVNTETWLEPLEQIAKSLVTAGYQTPAAQSNTSIYRESVDGVTSQIEALNAKVYEGILEARNIMKVFRILPRQSRTWGRAHDVYRAAGGNLDKAISNAKGMRPSRHEMPQFTASGTLRLIVELRRAGVQVIAREIDPSKLKLAQKAVNGPKVRELAKSGDTIKDRRIIVSSDMKILDGAHHVSAMKKLKLPVKVYLVNLPMQELLDHPAVWDTAQNPT